MKKIFYLFTASLLVFASCSKDDNDSSDPASSILVKKVTYTKSDGSNYSENFVYNGNKIVSLKGEDYVLKYTYTGELITKIEKFDKNNTLALTTEYVYTNDKLTISTTKEIGAPSYSQIKFVHNNDGTVSYEDFRINSSTNAEDDGGSIGKLTFKDGNLVENKYSYYGSEKLITYEYDTKNHPFKNVVGINLLLDIDPAQSYVNNVMYIIKTPGSATLYNYTYDSNNFPTEKKVDSSTSSSIIKNTQFFY